VGISSGIWQNKYLWKTIDFGLKYSYQVNISYRFRNLRYRYYLVGSGTSVAIAVLKI
jgi:hypothetical protein